MLQFAADMGVTLPDPEAAVDVRLEYLEDRVSLDNCKLQVSIEQCNMHASTVVAVTCTI